MLNALIDTKRINHYTPLFLIHSGGFISRINRYSLFLLL